MIFSVLINAAFAFAPSSTVEIGIEPTRTYQFDRPIQQRLKYNSNWLSFERGEGLGWSAVFDQRTHLPFRAWGPGLDFGVIATSEDAILYTRDFLSRQPVLLGGKATLGAASAAYDETLDAWYVEIDQNIALSIPALNDLEGKDESIHSASVWRGGFRAFFRDGKMTMFGSAFYPELINEAFESTISAHQAFMTAVEDGPAPNAEHDDVSARLIVLPLPVDEAIDFRLCWEIRSKTLMPKGHWVFFVDALSGELLHRYNEVRFLEGNLSAEHDERTVGSDLIESPLSQIRIPMDPQSIYVEMDGSYSIEGEPQAVVMKGLRTRIQNQAGNDFGFALTGGPQLVSSEGDEEVLAQIDQFVFQNQIYEWAESHAPHVVDSWPRSTVNVNINDNCNAFWDGELNFYTKGEGCNNTARIADVSYHEWGHGFHYHSLLSGEYDGSMSEGIADVVSFLQTRDHIMAPGFFFNGGGIREVSTDRVYPEDIVNEVHADGLIFGGSVWDYLNIKSAELGEEAAIAHVSDLLSAGIRSGPTLPESYYAFLFADDDNADLSDGTPNQCDLIEAFGRHGLGPGGMGLISLAHQPLVSQSPDLSNYPISVDLIQLAPNCLTAQPSNAVVWHSVDGGGWESTSLDLSSDLLTGDIPGAERDSLVSYYITLTDDEGRETSIPEGKNINPFTFFVGELEEIICNDFESDDGGFTHQLLSGEEQAGADDWMWGEPIGDGGDPSFAASGSKVWGNDLGGEHNGDTYNGEYQNQKWNRLTTPEIDVSAYDDVVLIYKRWLTVEDGYYDQARILANDEIVWSNHATREAIGDEHHLDKQWTSHAVHINATDIQGLQLSWEIESDRGLTMGGWNLDDVCLYQVKQPSPLDEDTIKDGQECGCSGVPGGSSRIPALFLGVFGLLVIRRRK